MLIFVVILAINPGSTSTKVSLWTPQQFVKASLVWDQPAMSLTEQSTLRFEQIEAWLHANSFTIQDLTCVVTRGGLLQPIPSGTYIIDAAMVADAEKGERGVHPANLGPILGKKIADAVGIHGYTVDPVSVDERLNLAHYTGYPPVERAGFGHILSLRAAAHRAAADLNKPLAESRFVMGHLGGGVSIAAVHGGRILDINNANDEGPFSTERAGGLPFGAVIDLCFQEGATEGQVLQRVLKQSGFQGYLHTMDLQVVEAMDTEESKAVWKAFVYQVAKEIGAYAAVLQGNVDAIVLTGGMAHSETLVAAIADYVQWVAAIVCYPGEEEMEALTAGARRVLSGEEMPKNYEEVIQ